MSETPAKYVTESDREKARTIANEVPPFIQTTISQI